ncbi:tetratricopeptide repeat protein 16 [Struthio camelus]|uniref:tetratricopeptide repeat protein 16 n=1 Tax=Struthio camelus TaxID=8801 RepID=UPI003603CA08
MEMEAGGLFATMVPEKQLEERCERSLEKIFRPSQCLRSIEGPREVKCLPVIVQDRMQEHWQKGLDFSSLGQWEEAITCYSKAINLDPQRVKGPTGPGDTSGREAARLRPAAMLAVLGSLSRARLGGQHALRVSMVQAELYQQRAEAFLQLCDFQSAMLNFRKALTLAPAQQQPCLARLALVLDLQGRCLLDQELYCEALEAFTRAAELQPHCRVFRQRSIMCLAALNKFPECLQTVNRDLKEDVRNPDLYVLRASLYERFGVPGPDDAWPPGQLALCYQDIQQALELEPQHGAAQALKQRLLRRGREAKAEAVTKALRGDLRGALLKISFAIENDPWAADFFILRGTLLRRLKNFSAACEDFARARELGAEGGPEAQEAWRQLVLTYNDCAVRCYALGLFDEAVRLLGEALRNEKREKGLYINRGDCFLRLGELAYALADYQQALELSPGDWGVRRRVAMVLHEQGQQDLAARQYQEAEARFSAAIKHDPHKPLYYLCRARARVRRGGVESAREDVALSLWLDPTDSEVQPWHRSPMSAMGNAPSLLPWLFLRLFGATVLNRESAAGVKRPIGVKVQVRQQC